MFYFYANMLYCFVKSYAKKKIVHVKFWENNDRNQKVTKNTERVKVSVAVTWQSKKKMLVLPAPPLSPESVPITHLYPLAYSHHRLTNKTGYLEPLLRILVR